MKVAVYGGSFNPLHKGHEAILRHITRDTQYGLVLMVVTPQNPFKAGDPEVSDAEERFRLAQEALDRHPDIDAKACDIELKMEPPQYTVRTLDALKARHPEDEFTLICGADCLESFPRWKDYQRILLEYGIAVFPRKGYHRGRLRQKLLKENPRYKIELLKMPVIPISSSEIRAAMDSGKDMTKWLM